MHVRIVIHHHLCGAWVPIKVNNSYLHGQVHIYLMTRVLSHPNHPMHVKVTSHSTFSVSSIKEYNWMSGRICNLKFVVVQMVHIEEMNL